jgi:PPOX class probable FMN-dependent enzyme
MRDLSDLITIEDELRAVLGFPANVSVAKTLPVLDGHSQAHIACSPFVLIASSDMQGRLDVSPKGDPPGFVQVLDERTLAIPDRPGNRRADTFLNVLQNPAVGLLFLVPGKADTLRVNGRAQIAREGWLLDRMIVRGNRPHLALVVQVDEVFFHCAKCVMRSDLWNAESWPSLEGLAPLARILADQTALMDEAAMQAVVEESYEKRLY